MHLVISTCLYCVGIGLAFPSPSPGPIPWIQFQSDLELPQLEQYQHGASGEFVGPAFFGQMHNPPMTRIARNPQPDPTFNFVGHGIMAGINFIDNLVPPVMESAVKPIYPKNFTRPRRHENDTSTITTTLLSEIQTTQTSLTDAFSVVTPITLTTVMEDKMDKVSTSPTKSQTADLESMISQLNKALEYIQIHGNEKVNEEISNKTSTEKLVQYISSNVEQIVKNKNTDMRSMKVKQISKALDILLNRIATSAKDLIPKGQQHAKPDPMLMARIVQHVNNMKTQIVSDKVNSGYELSSAELDGGLHAKFRPVRQDGDEDDAMNSIDTDDDNDGKDVEQIVPKNGEPTTTTAKAVTARQEENSDQQSSSQEGGGNLVANLLSSFLGSLSKPNGAVDVDAIVGLVSGLSVQQDDGTFDFSGITDLLQSFLGGGDDGGGSDVGAFLGGLLGAVIQGSANPPGPKGTGRWTGNLLANILPGLSGPPPPSSSEEAGNGNQQPQKPIDSGSFLAGLLTSMLGSSSGTSSGSTPMNGADNNKMGSAGFFMKMKQELFKTIFSLITSILGASSGGLTQASGASSGASSNKFGGKH